MKLDSILTADVSALEQAIAESPSEYRDIHLVLYCDGGCDNTGDKIGGWGVHGYWFNEKPTNSNSECKGAIPTHKGYITGKASNQDVKANVLAYLDYSGGLESPSTNNLAEMEALSRAFACLRLYSALKSVQIFTDSDYVKRGLLEFLKGWKSRDWVNSTGKEVANKPQWLNLENAYQNAQLVVPNGKLEIIKIKGHSGDRGNDNADELATMGAWRCRNNGGFATEQLTVHSVGSRKVEEAVHPLLTENRLFFDHEPKVTNDGHYYYQSNNPYDGTDTEKDEQLGKRVTDLMLSVVCLASPEPVVDNLQQYVVEDRGYHGVFKTRLDTIRNADNYRTLIENPSGHVLTFNDAEAKIGLPNKTPLFNVINPARFAYRVFTEFEQLKSVLDAIRHQQGGYDLYRQDITSCIYDISTKKEQLVYKVHKDLKDTVSVPIKIDGVIEDTLQLTFGVDAPSRLGFNRFKHLNPVVYLFINLYGNSYFRYYVYVEVDSGCAIWSPPYSNEVILPQP